MKTILVVEDDRTVRENLIELFETENFMVLAAEDGVAGYNLIADNSIDIILSDIRMPNMDGLQFLQLLQSNKETARIPFVFLTAKVEMNDLRIGMNHGADDYVTKPYEAKELLNIIRMHLHKNDTVSCDVRGIKEKLLTRFPHELKNALCGIIGFSELIGNEGDSLSHEDIKRMARVINTSGKRLHTRIEKFLQYSELVSLSKKDVANIIERTGSFSLDPFTMMVGLQKIAIEYEREDDVCISFDSGALQIHEKFYKIILNELFENKIKSTRKGTGVYVKGLIDKDYYRTKVFEKTRGKKCLNQIESLQQPHTNYERQCVDEVITFLKDSLRLFNGYIKINGGKNNRVQIEFGIPLENSRRRNEKNIFN